MSGLVTFARGNHLKKTMTVRNPVLLHMLRFLVPTLTGTVYVNMLTIFNISKDYKERKHKYIK